MRTKTINIVQGAFGQPSVPFLLSRRAHLLTTPKGRWYCQRLHRMQTCALRGGCGSCGSLMDNATALRRCCHCPRSWCAVCTHRIPSFQPTVFHQLPAQTCHRQLCCGYDPKFSLGSFSFCEKETKTRAKGR